MVPLVLLLAATCVHGYQTMVVTFDIMPPEEAGEPSAEEVAQQLASVVSDGEPLNHPFKFDSTTAVEIEHRSQASTVEVDSQDDIHITAGGLLETKARSLFGRFAEDVDVTTNGAQFRAADGGIEFFSSEGADVEVGGTMTGMVDGDLKATATGKAEIEVHESIDGRTRGNATASVGGDVTLLSGGSGDVAFADSLWVSSGYVGIESGTKVEVSSDELSANGLERVSVAALGSAVELIGAGDIEYVGFVWRSSTSFHTFGE